jgi:hypothetical protein
VKDEITGEAVPIFPVWKKFVRWVVAIPSLLLASATLSIVVSFCTNITKGLSSNSPYVYRLHVLWRYGPLSIFRDEKFV